MNRYLYYRANVLSTVRPSLRGAAAGIGREGERNRRFVGERRHDRLTAQQAFLFVRPTSDGVAGVAGRPDDGL